MKLLFASHSASGGGGAELALAELLAGLADEGVELHVVFPSDGPLRDRCAALGARTSIEPHLWTWIDWPRSLRGRARQVGGHALGIARLATLVRRARPDAVVTNTLVIPGAALAARAAGVPHVWSVHELGVRDHGFRFALGYARSLRAVSRLSAVVVGNSRSVMDELARHVDRRKLRLVRYAVEMPPASPPPLNGTLRAVLVGTKAPGKGQMEAINAAALLRRDGIPVRLRLVGGGDPAFVADLERLAAELGVADAVELVPETPNVLQHFEWSHVALVCSRAEAFGRVTVEAMKAGRPVVGARSAGTAELVSDGQTGLLYEPGDAADLASRLKLLHDTPELAARLVETAQAWAAREFTRERYVEGFRRAVQEAVG